MGIKSNLRPNRQQATVTALTALVLGILAVSQVTAGERLVFKSTLSDGTVVYSDAPAKGAGAVNRLYVEPHADDPIAASRAQLEHERHEEAALQAIDQRSRRAAALLEQVAHAEGQLKALQQQRSDAAQVRDGDRDGRRWAPQYAQRQMKYASAEEQASARLAALRKELAAAQP